VKRVISVYTICEAMNVNEMVKSMLSDFHILIRLYLTITSGTMFEKSFSALRFVLN
jgi:hypothetical protein